METDPLIPRRGNLAWVIFGINFCLMIATISLQTGSCREIVGLKVILSLGAALMFISCACVAIFLRTLQTHWMTASVIINMITVAVAVGLLVDDVWNLCGESNGIMLIIDMIVILTVIQPMTIFVIVRSDF
jgi:hypothetical protein